MSDDGQNLRKTTVRIPEPLFEAFDAAVDDAPDYLGLSRAELVRHAVDVGVRDWSGDAEELVPDEMMARALVESRRERIKAEARVMDLRAGWRGRVKSYLNARLAGEEPYHPDDVAALASDYRDELRMLHEAAPESARSLDEDMSWLDDVLDAYVDAYRAKQVVPDESPYAGVDDAIETGRDLMQLQGRAAELVDEIGERAESQAYDPDAIIRSLAAEYGVGEPAIKTVLDWLLPDDVDRRQALKSLEDQGVEKILPPAVVDDADDRAALAEADVDRVDPSTTRDSPDDLADGTLTLSADDLPDDPDAPGVDDDKVESIVEDRIRGNGADVDGLDVDQDDDERGDTDD